MVEPGAIEDRLGDAEPDAPHARARHEQRAEAARGEAQRAGDGELRHLVGDGDADVGAGRMQLRLGGAHVGPLLDQLRGQAQRQVLRQFQLGEIEALAAILVRRAADQAHQLVALLGELLLQRRQRRAGLGQRRFLGQHVGARGAAQVELAAHHAERVLEDADDVLGGVDLRLQRGEVDRRDHDVGGERQIRRLELEALHLGQRLLRFDLAAHAAEHVGRVGDVERGRGDAVHDGRTRLALRRQRGELLLALAVGRKRREQRALLGIKVLARLAERCLRGVDVGIGLQGFLDQRVELRRVEERPPFAGDVHGGHEALRRAAGAAGRAGLRRQRFGRVAGGRGLGGPLEVGTGAAAGEKSGGKGRREKANAYAY